MNNKGAKIRLDDNNVISIGISDTESLENNSVIGTYLTTEKVYDIKIVEGLTNYVFKDISISAEDFVQSGSKYKATFEANGEEQIVTGASYEFSLEGDPDSPYTLHCENNGILTSEIPPVTITKEELNQYSFAMPVARSVVISLKKVG